MPKDEAGIVAKANTGISDAQNQLIKLLRSQQITPEMVNEMDDGLVSLLSKKILNEYLDEAINTLGDRGNGGNWPDISPLYYKVFSQDAPVLLGVLVPKIMNLPLQDQAIIFEGKKNIFKGRVDILIYDSHGDDAQKKINDTLLNKGYFGIARLLYQLKVKAEDLNDRKESEAYKKADVLHSKLTTSFSEYLLPNHEASYETLKSTWDKAINQAKPELEKHRGWKNFLANLGLFIATVGIAHAGAAIADKITGTSYVNNHGLFSLTKTDSAQHIDELEESVKKIKPD